MPGDVGAHAVRVTTVTFVEAADRRLLSRTVGLLVITHIRFHSLTAHVETSRLVVSGKVDVLGGLVDAHTFEYWVSESTAGVDWRSVGIPTVHYSFTQVRLGFH